MASNQTVIQYVLSRLKDLGVTDAFGIPGDFVYPVCDAIVDDPDIKWIGCANEVNASYAADGYARTKGVGVLVTTYGAGESYIFGGLAQVQRQQPPRVLNQEIRRAATHDYPHVGPRPARLKQPISDPVVQYFYWSVNLYQDFDNEPPPGASENDFGVSTSWGVVVLNGTSSAWPILAGGAKNQLCGADK